MKSNPLDPRPRDILAPKATHSHFSNLFRGSTMVYRIYSFEKHLELNSNTHTQVSHVAEHLAVFRLRVSRAWAV